MKQGFGLALAMVLASTVVAGPAGARTVFFDNFDSENGGVLPNGGIANYTGFINFVPGTFFGGAANPGRVDIIRNGFGFPPIICSGNRGLCVDLDGSPGSGEIKSRASFAVRKNDKIVLSFDLSGNQRGIFDPGPDNFYSGFQFASNAIVNGLSTNYRGIVDSAFNPTFTTTGFLAGARGGIPANSPFFRGSISFTAGNSSALRFFLGTTSRDNIGPIIDNIQLDITRVGVPEPASWALMIAGFGLTGCAMRRRRGNVRVLA